ncbi:MAG: zinc/iron-chelating domain-containing protein [Planctomycetaceae bacterium]|nr:zinc/iron-chelating domain-containing protein [Planctomycetaceae bacterium]
MLLCLETINPDSCDDCGLCCEGIGSPVLLYASRGDDSEPHPYRPDDLPAELLDEINFHFSGLARGQEPQERCLWYDTDSRRCRHYQWRPQVCRDYALGGDACLLERENYLKSVNEA